MHWNFVDALFAGIACAVYLAITLAWVHLSSQTKVSRVFRNSLAITVRLIFLHATAFFFLCVWFGVPVIYLLAFLAIVLALSPAASTDEHSGINAMGDDPITLAVGVVVLLPVFVLKQYVLGFPERDNVILSPPQVSSVADQIDKVDSRLKPLFENIAVVVVPLKPMGIVQINGERFSAVSVDGMLIEAGKAVQVHDSRNGMLLVRLVIEKSETAGWFP